MANRNGFKMEDQDTALPAIRKKQDRLNAVMNQMPTKAPGTSHAGAGLRAKPVSSYTRNDFTRMRNQATGGGTTNVVDPGRASRMADAAEYRAIEKKRKQAKDRIALETASNPPLPPGGRRFTNATAEIRRLQNKYK